ncbi:MAG: RHS repeat protein [Kineosporiaceae bacterium]|nr:RHS repeat protein [Kineosporiaceae bacterium]
MASRPDLVSAGVSARAQGSRVEVESLRDELTTTWANPDGTLTTEAHVAPIRFRNAQGRWRDVDLDLTILADGTVGPKGHPKGLNLAGPRAASGKGTASAPVSDLGRVDESRGKAERSLVFGWSGRLPAPTIAGTTATYPDVSPEIDVVVSARRTGFEQDIVIKTPAALAAAVKTAGAKPVSWSFPLKLNGLTARAQDDGSIAFLDGNDQTVSQLVAPSAWDGAVDARSGEHTATSPVAMTVKATGPNRAVVTLTPDRAWLTDPARVFPITIDPTYASGSTYASFDTYVSKAYPTTAYSTSTELRVGTYNGGTDAARSFLTFPLAGILGKDIVSGSLSLYETHSWSCTAKPFNVHYALGTTTSTTWNTQPAAGTQYGSTSAARGYSSSCPAGRVNLDVSDLVKWWATTSSSHGGIRLSASETDNEGWKKFASSESATDPLVSYTYNRKPNAATVPVLQAPPANTYQAPGSSTAMVFTSDSTPTLSASATDPDASKVNMTIEVHSSTAGTAASKVTTCATGLVASGGTGACTSATALADSTTYYARTAVKDERGLWNGTWSPWRTFYTSFGAPPTPTITCPAPHTNNAWQDDPPAADVTCTIAAPGVAGTYLAPGYVDLVVDGVAQARRVITASNDAAVAKTTWTFSRLAPGAHTITATALSRSLRASTAAASYGFGWGGASMSYPSSGATSSGMVKVSAEGPPRGSAPGVSAKLRWRVAGAGDETSGWTDGPTLNATAAASTDIVKADGAWDVRTAVRESGASADLPARTPILFDVQVCFTYTGVATAQCSWSQAKSTLTRVPHAFGEGYPVADAGPGQVALFTGEVAVSGSDVSVPGYASDITLSRSHVSFDGDGSVAGWPADPVTGVFGPGWTANLQGPEGVGLAGMQVLDNTRRDGTIVLVDQAGEPLVFQNPARTRAYAVAGTAYRPVNDAAIDADLVLQLAGTGTASTMTVTEPDGTATVWRVLAAPVSTVDTQWKPVSVTEPGAVVTTFAADSGGRVTRMVSAAPGLDCATLVKGCRAVDIAYATTTTATAGSPGNYTGRVSSLSATLWNPTASAMATTVVAAYAYDTAGRLVRVRDPRTGLGTDYGWDGASTRIASITPTGLAAYRYSYDTATNPSAPKLAQVSRDGATPGAPAVTLIRYVYGVPTSGTDMPDVSTDAVSAWFQSEPATQGFAVFGEDYTGPVTGDDVEWSYADLFYTDADGYTVNTASYGAGTWLITGTDYDQRGNTVRALDGAATARAVALKAQLGIAWSEGQADALANLTVYNSDLTNAAGAVVSPAGTLVTDTYGPTRNAMLADGTVLPARPHTRTTYDTGAPNNGINPTTGEPYRLPTQVVTAAATATGTDLETLTTLTNAYDPVVTGDGDGWALGAPTQVTTSGPNGLGGTVSITRTTRFDTEGRPIETRQPLSTGADAGTTRTTYYTVGANSADAACGNRAEWAGLTCRTYPAAAPDNGPTLPDERTTAYSMWLHPTQVVETSGTSTRTTTTSYDTAERVVTAAVTASEITGSTPRPGTYTHYRTSDGLIDYRGALNGAGNDADPTARTSYGYDLWGRPTSYTNDHGEVTTTSYGPDGRIASVTDPLGTASYAYTELNRHGFSRGWVLPAAGAAGGWSDGSRPVRTRRAECSRSWSGAGRRCSSRPSPGWPVRGRRCRGTGRRG